MFDLRAVKIVVLLLILSPLMVKMVYIDNVLYEQTGTRLFWAMSVLVNDAIIFSGMILLFYLSYLRFMARVGSVVLRCLALFVALIYLIDILIIINFNAHLVIADAIKYASYSLNYVQQIYRGKAWLLILIALLVVGFLWLVVFSRYQIKGSHVHGYSIAAILILFFVSYFATDSNDQYVHSWAYKNVVDYNRVVLSESKAYSPQFVNDFSFDEPQTCYSREPEKRNVILLMVESLSSYQSQYFSGIRNWTPNLDKIARNNQSFHNFYANGFTTEDAEVALLTGLLPIYSPSSYTDDGGVAFSGFFDIKASLPNILREYGYTSEFLTTADLEFSNTRDWGMSIGFDYMEGQEHPYYEGWERFHFNAAPDEALYHRIFDRIEQNSQTNFFMFIKTVSTHHPFINPENHNRSEAETFLYADKQIGLFYDKLKATGFFDDGLLIVLGDHRAMVPINAEEIDRFGAHKAVARVPMIVSYGDQYSEQETTQYQQTDIFNFLKGLVLDTQCYSDWTGDFFSKKPAQYIAHRRGDHRNVVSVFAGEEEYMVTLNGDQTRVTNNDPENHEISAHIVGKINAARLLRYRE